MSNDRVELNFNPETGRFLLELAKADVGLGDRPVTYHSKSFWPKEEVHITIIGGRLAETVACHIQTDPALAERVEQAIITPAWRYRMEDEWYHVVRDDEVARERGKGVAESIVRMAMVPALPGFYRRLEQLLDVTIPERPAHVTLYTWNDPRGIGLPTWELFEARVQGPVSPELWQ